jgi:transposase
MSGRPPKYDSVRAKRITDALSAGNTRRAAAEYGGISEATLMRWQRRYADFDDAVKSAEASAEVAHVANIAQASAGGTWQASAWWLERRRHHDWGKVDRVEVEVRRVAQRVAAQTGADPDWLVKRAAEIVAAETESER